MKTAKSAPVLDQLVAPLGDCLTPESARRLLALKVDPKLQARVDDLAGRHSRGLLTSEEQAEYGGFRFLDTLLCIAKTEARPTPGAYRRVRWMVLYEPSGVSRQALRAHS